jgi:hypothetical protein
MRIMGVAHQARSGEQRGAGNARPEPGRGEDAFGAGVGTVLACRDMALEAPVLLV